MVAGKKTTYRGGRAYTISDIVKLIEAGSSAGIQYLRLKDLEIKFSGKMSLPLDESKNHLISPSSAPIDDIEAESFVREEEEKRVASSLYDELSELQLRDPVEYERLIIEGAIDGEGTQGSTGNI